MHILDICLLPFIILLLTIIATATYKIHEDIDAEAKRKSNQRKDRNR